MRPAMGVRVPERGRAARAMRAALSAVALSAAALSVAAAPGAAQPDSVAGLGAFAKGEPNRGLAVVPLTITTSDRRVHRYLVEVAATPEQQARGMMFRTEMARDTGMIFPFDPPRPAAFWMRNTFISLDLVFIGTDGRVRGIAPRAAPLSESLIPSDGPVAAVLELKGGEAERIGLRKGDRIAWPRAPLGAAGRGR